MGNVAGSLETSVFSAGLSYSQFTVQFSGRKFADSYRSGCQMYEVTLVWPARSLEDASLSVDFKTVSHPRRSTDRNSRARERDIRRSHRNAHFHRFLGDQGEVPHQSY
ncbi:uncharacterized protein LOC116426465 isoform X1 [Nomia melanderi]|uniref:uncharacterized protein LOC116426465 isoform X1 n=1 Tax=Nomia melanderi TaxID=2448451 RepID=UPI003FCD2494